MSIKVLNFIIIKMLTSNVTNDRSAQDSTLSWLYLYVDFESKTKKKVILYSLLITIQLCSPIEAVLKLYSFNLEV